jgi:H+/Cl- antiporter ClcA
VSAPDQPAAAAPGEPPTATAAQPAGSTTPPGALPTGGHPAVDPPGLDGAAYLRLIGLAALIGIPAALVAALFMALVNSAQGWLWTDLPNALGQDQPPWYLVLFLPAVGAALVLVARKLLPGDGGHDPLDGLSMAPVLWQHAPSVVLAALGTLVFGAILGPEAPLIALGSMVGSLVTVFVRLGPRETQVISTAGSFSAISALFGGPLVAGILMIEAGVGMGALLIPALLPGLVAAAIGYVLFVGFGDWGGLSTTGLAVSGLPPYHGTHLGDLLLAVVIGIVAGLLLAVVRQVGAAVRGLRTSALGMAGVLLLGGLVVGALALSARGLGADSQDVLFSGQKSLGALVAEPSVKIVLILLVAKAIGYAVSLGSGFRGGPVFPAIFLGVALGSVAELVFHTSPTLAVAVGCAAGMAAMTRLLFASLLLALMLVGSNGFDAIPAAVLAAAAAWVVTKSLDARLATRQAAATG